MKLYITRHGQVGECADYIGGDAFLPQGEVPLSLVGREQGRLLGKFLAKCDFHGVIYASPFWRTMETAELVAQETGSEIFPMPWLHEIFCEKELVKEYAGTPFRKLRQWYKHIAKDAVLEPLWWPSNIEDRVDVMKRVSEGIEALLKQYSDTDEEILLVGHAASIGAANRYLKLKRGGLLWNCSLGLYDTKNPDQNFGKNICFLPGQIVTNNHLFAYEFKFPEDEQVLWEIEIPKEVIESQGFKLLHIGDIHSATFSFYCQLIKQIRPNAIFYTGDISDNDMPDCAAYCQKVAALAEILRQANCPVYWVVGDCDLPDKIAEIAPFFEITKPNTVLEIQGQRICVAHSRQQVTEKADFYLYGHEIKNSETFEQELNFMGADNSCLNALRNVFVIALPEKRIFRIERPN